ncbi:MAG: hypothetical protein ACXWRG_18890 [Bdellovibrio sp.]
MKFRQFFYLMAVLLLNAWALPGQAYFVATEPAQLRPGLPTDVFVAGFGNDQGNQFLRTAILAAKVSKDRFPSRQRVIISAVNESLSGERSMLSSGGFGFKKADEDSLTKEQLVYMLRKLSVPVSSLQFFGHANTYNGFRLQSRTNRLDQTDKEFAQIGKFLAKNAFVAFYSCNSGWLLAPAAAKLMKRPAFGTLTSSNFREMMSDGQWYGHDKGMYPENLEHIGETTNITRQSMNCGPYKCMRLSPENSEYVDEFGKFEKGLGFFKVFSTDNDLIPQALIHFTLLTPTVVPLSLQSSRQDFEKAVADWMCPADKSNKKRRACQQAIEDKDYLNKPQLSFFSGDPVACTNQGCYTTVKCKAVRYILGARPCKTVDLNSSIPSTVFSDQLKMYFKGVELLEKGQLDL